MILMDPQPASALTCTDQYPAGITTPQLYSVQYSNPGRTSMRGSIAFKEAASSRHDHSPDPTGGLGRQLIMNCKRPRPSPVVLLA